MQVLTNPGTFSEQTVDLGIFIAAQLKHSTSEGRLDTIGRLIEMLVENGVLDLRSVGNLFYTDLGPY